MNYPVNRYVNYSIDRDRDRDRSVGHSIDYSIDSPKYSDIPSIGRFLYLPYLFLCTYYCTCVKCETCTNFDNNKYHKMSRYRNGTEIVQCDTGLYCRFCNAYKRRQLYNYESQFPENINEFRRDSDQYGYDYHIMKYFLNLIPFIISIIVSPFMLTCFILTIIANVAESIINFILIHNKISYVSIDTNYIDMGIQNFCEKVLTNAYLTVYSPIKEIFNRKSISMLGSLLSIFGITVIVPLLLSIMFENISTYMLIFLTVIVEALAMNMSEHIFYGLVLIIVTITNIPLFIALIVHYISMYIFYVILNRIVNTIIENVGYPFLSTHPNYANNTDGLNICELKYSQIIYFIMGIFPKALVYVPLSIFGSIVFILRGCRNTINITAE